MATVNEGGGTPRLRPGPGEQSGVLALNEIASGVGQGLGAVLGTLVLQHASAASLGWAGATCAAAALILSILGSRFSDKGWLGPAVCTSWA
jgi:predicted MFS family arabinose efflux permease